MAYRECSHTVVKGETLSDLLFRYGTEHNVELPIYGRGRWIDINKRANPHITEWRQLEPGEVILLKVPAQIKTCELSSQKPEPTAAVPPPPPKPVIVETIPPAAEEPVVTEPLKEEPPTDPIPSEPTTALPEKELPKAKKESSKTRFSPGRWLKERLSSAVSVRYGKSLAPKNFVLLPDIAQWSVVFESRYQPLRKLRVYVDYVPRINETYLGTDYHLESQRVQVGRAFLFGPTTDTLVEIVPKIGYWNYQSAVPYFSATAANKVDLGFKTQLNLGIELSLAHDLGAISPRIWVGADGTSGYMGLGEKDTAGGTSYRAGVELAAVGPTIHAGSMEISTLGFLFGNAENVNITHGVQTTLATPTTPESESANSKNMSYNINVIGVGLGVAW